jgi:hypothetical protein
MRVHHGMSYGDIGKALFGSNVKREMENGFGRLSTAAVYSKVHEFCLSCCGVCDGCKLNEFVLAKLIRKKL